MAVAHTVARGGEGLAALGLGGVLDDVGPGAVVWVVGDGESDLAEGLSERGAEARRLAGEPGPALEAGAPVLLVLGRADPAATGAALAAAHRAGCPFAYTRLEAACEQARDWYWCHQVPAAGPPPPPLSEAWSRAGRGAPECQNRYGHWVGWRRLLPARQGPAVPVPAPPPAR